MQFTAERSMLVLRRRYTTLKHFNEQRIDLSNLKCAFKTFIEEWLCPALTLPSWVFLNGNS
jgi:hypothetical protein